MVIVNALHVISKVPLAGKAVSKNSTFAALVDAEERLVSVAVQAMSLPLMAQETCGR